MSTVTLTNVEKSFGAQAVLHGINLHIEDGEFVVLLGPSGCGKSTLLRLICGLEKVTGGEIAIDDRLVNDIPPKDRDIAMVFQSYALYPNLTVERNLAFSMEMRGYKKADIKEKVEAAARLLGLKPYMKRLPKQLSGGQRQRVAMGRAIVRDPRVFLFDEPLSNLDAKMRVQMRIEIKSLHQRLKTTVVYVTHDQIEAMTMADRVVLMNDGRIEQVGEPLALYDEPRNVFTAGFIGSPSMNFVKCTYSRANGTLMTDRGHEIAFGASRELADGSYLVGFRPEDIELGSGSETPGLPGVVEVVEPTGAEVLIVVEYGERQLQIVTKQRSAVGHGDAVTIMVPEDAIHVFDEASGARVDGGLPAS